MNNYTQIRNLDQKLDIMDHINQDHGEELLTIAQAEYHSAELTSARIIDVVEEGIIIRVHYNDHKDNDTVFIRFEIDGDLEQKILYLAYDAIVKQGRDFSGTANNYFEVLGKQAVTANITRLTLQSKRPIPEYYPGYAYAFSLNIFKKLPNKKPSKASKKSKLKNWFDRGFMWMLKHLSAPSREKLLSSINKRIRLYTVRQSWQSDVNKGFVDCAYVDIYRHGNSLGSQWVEALKVGDVIVSRSETADNHQHLHTGRALLIADETAYPALAGILEKWCNSQPPYVVITSANPTELAYFEQAVIPKGSVIKKLVCKADKQAELILPLLEKLDCIEVAWGAMESNSAKQIRHYLRNHRKLPGKHNHIKAYWRLSSN